MPKLVTHLFCSVGLPTQIGTRKDTYKSYASVTIAAPMRFMSGHTSLLTAPRRNPTENIFRVGCKVGSVKVNGIFQRSVSACRYTVPTSSHDSSMGLNLFV